MDIHQLIAAINPDVFCDPSARREVKRILQAAKARGDNSDYASAACEAIPVEPNRIAIEHLEHDNPFRLPAFKSPIQRHTLVYDSFEESLEAFYFWLLDELAAEGWTVGKLVDTFRATPGSGLASDLGRREIQAQHEAMNMLREADSLVRDILRTATLSKGEDTLPVATNTNDRGWSEVERSLLRSKIERLKLYARWLGPYLKQARQLEQKAGDSAGLVSVFNTTAVEIILLAERIYPVEEDVNRGELPKMFLNAKRRICFPILILEMKLRAAPERTSPGAYGYRGRFELATTSYALNEDELAVLKQEIDRDNLGEVLGAVSGRKGMALNELVRQIEALVAEPSKQDSKPDDPNPFTSLFAFKGAFGDEEKASGGETREAGVNEIRRDSDFERVIRSQTILEARRRCLDFYTRCKQALKMVGV